MRSIWFSVRFSGLGVKLSNDIPTGHHADRCLLQRHVQSDIVLPLPLSIVARPREAGLLSPGELIPLPLSGWIPELPHVAKAE